MIALTSGFSAYAAEIVAMRASQQKDFHRLTIIFSEEIPVEVDLKGEKLLVRMRELETSKLAHTPSTDYIRVKGLTATQDQTGKLSTMEVSVSEGSTVKHSSRPGPFRVILDVYPPSSLVLRKEGPRSMDESRLLEPDAQRLVAFNDSWRWLYRKKAIEILKQELYRAPLSSPFRVVPGVPLTSADSIVKGLESASAAQKQLANAVVLNAIADFYSNTIQHAELETIIRANPSDFTALAFFVMGDRFERKGFYPEAAGYFTRAIGPKDNPLRPEVLFRRGRIFFFEDKYADAKDWFKRSLDEGYKDAGVWLANTALIKGEMELAWPMYKEHVRAVEELDPISRLSVADTYLTRGTWQEARYAYAAIRARFPNQEFLETFLTLKEGDALLAEGKLQEAVILYSRTKEKLKGEAWAISTLSLADARFSSNKTEDLLKAEKLYESVAGGSFTGSEIAHLRLAAARIRLGKFEEANDDVTRFASKYPLSPVRQDIDKLSSVLLYEWLDSLYRKGDHVAALKLFLETPLSIPFGRKADIYLKIGTSSMEAGLNGEAVSMLDNAAKMGTPRVAEEAMLLLARVYLSQRDTGSAERLLRAFRTRFPRSSRKAEIAEIEVRIAFEKGEHAQVASYTGSAEPELMVMRAESVYKSGRAKEAAALFEKAALALNSRGSLKAAAKAYARYADASFDLNDFDGAARGYGLSLKLMGPDEKEERSWALYRMAQCFSRLGREAEKKAALKELKDTGGELSPWSERIFKEAATL